MKAFSAFHYGGDKDGQLALFYPNFTVKDFTFVGLTTTRLGQPAAIFDYQWSDQPPVRYVTEYGTMVRAARKALAEA